MTDFAVYYQLRAFCLYVAITVAIIVAVVAVKDFRRDRSVFRLIGTSILALMLIVACISLFLMPN